MTESKPLTSPIANPSSSARPIDLRPDHLRIVLDILREHLPVGAKVWVFGSRADWTTKDSSDLDIALEAEDELSHKLLDTLKDVFGDSILPYTVDVVDLNRISGSFKQIVESQRVSLPINRDRTREHTHPPSTPTGKTAHEETPLTTTPSEWHKPRIDESTESWNEVLLGDCVEINDDTYSPEEAWPFINYVQTSDLTDNRLSSPKKLLLTQDKIPSRARRKLKPGDILYSTVRPNQRHYGILKDLPDNTLASTRFATIRGKQGVANTDYLYYYLTQSHIVDNLQTIAEHSTSAYPSIKPSDLKQLNIRLPPLPEQRAIAHILGTLDNKIELNRQMSETLEETAKTLFKSWFIDFDPVRAKMEGHWRRNESLSGLPANLYDLFPNQLVDSELGPIPKGWTVSTLGDCFDLVMGRSPRSEYYNDIGEGLPFHQGVANFGKRFPIHRRWATQGDRIAEPGDILLSVRSPVGRINVALDRLILGRGISALRAQDKHYNFSLMLLKVKFAVEDSMGSGTISKAVTRKDLKSTLIVKPPVSVVEEYEATCRPTANLVENLWHQNQMLREARDLLLPRLVSGELYASKNTR